MHRRVISTGARMLARPLTTVSDPMSGFFGISKKYVLFPFHHDKLNIVQSSLGPQSSWLQNCPRSPFEIAASCPGYHWSPVLVRNTQGRRIQAHRKSHVEISWTIEWVVLVEVFWIDYCDGHRICYLFCNYGSTDRYQLGQISTYESVKRGLSIALLGII